MREEQNKRPTLTRRFILRYLLAILAVFVISEGLIWLVEGAALQREVDDLLTAKIHEVESDVADTVANGFVIPEEIEGQAGSTDIEFPNNYIVGEGGFVLIANAEGRVVSSSEAAGLDDQQLANLGFSKEGSGPMESFVTRVNNTEYVCMYDNQNNHDIIALVPRSEIVQPRNLIMGLTAVAELLIFLLFFIIVWVLLRNNVTKDLHKVRDSLGAIADGKLDEKVDVRSSAEFSELSDSINETVDRLGEASAQAQRRVEEDMERAKEIQLSSMPNVFPAFQSIPQIDLYAFIRPALEVGGDFYDFAKIQSDVVTFEVADVSGKGIPGALYMMRAKTTLKGLVNAGLGIDTIMETANNALCANNDANMFVTAWFGLFEAGAGRLIYSNAGHTHAIRRHADGTCEYMNTKPGLVMGAMEDVKYKFYVVPFDSGDVLFLYTDGVTEATNANNELYGEDRLLKCMQGINTTDPKEICEIVTADVDAFVGDAPQFDDITMLALEYRGDKEV